MVETQVCVSILCCDHSHKPHAVTQNFHSNKCTSSFLRDVTCLNFSSSAGLGSNSAPPIPDSRLGEENKGHQMLVKMGKVPWRVNDSLWAFGIGDDGIRASSNLPQHLE